MLALLLLFAIRGWSNSNSGKWSDNPSAVAGSERRSTARQIVSKPTAVVCSSSTLPPTKDLAGSSTMHTTRTPQYDSTKLLFYFEPTMTTMPTMIATTTTIIPPKPPAIMTTSIFSATTIRIGILSLVALPALMTTTLLFIMPLGEAFSAYQSVAVRRHCRWQPLPQPQCQQIQMLLRHPSQQQQGAAVAVALLMASFPPPMMDDGPGGDGGGGGMGRRSRSMGQSFNANNPPGGAFSVPNAGNTAGGGGGGTAGGGGRHLYEALCGGDCEIALL